MRFFSPERANALIPVLLPLIEDMWAKRRALAIALLEQDPALRKAAGRAGASTTNWGSEALKADVVRTVALVQTYGCIVKDLDLGLIDFPAVREGRPVFLCWKPGEPSVAHWHATDETFAERKPL